MGAAPKSGPNAGPLEAAGIGLPLSLGDMAFRLDFFVADLASYFSACISLEGIPPAYKFIGLFYIWPRKARSFLLYGELSVYGEPMFFITYHAR
jgi:hypothetical protein